MEFKYTYEKKEVAKKDISFMQIYFDNGDNLKIKNTEIVDVSVEFADNMIWFKGGISQVVASGFIKLKINFSKIARYNNVSVYNPKAFIKDRKGYIENRCVNDGVKYLEIYNEYNCHITLCGNIFSKLDGEYLILEFKNVKNLKNNGSVSSIMLSDVEKNNIETVFVDFENCDGFELFKEEIIDIHLEIQKELELSSSDFVRLVTGGFIKFKLSNEVFNRDITMIDGKTKLKNLENRVCGKKGEGYHDICNLYVSYVYSGNESKREHFEVQDIRSKEVVDKIEEENECPDDGWWFVGGYAKRNKDKTITIFFGKTDTKDIEKV